MGKLFRLVVLLLLAPFVYAFLYEAYLFVSSNVTFEEIQWFALGLAIYLLLYVLFLRNRIQFVELFKHELAHALTSLLFFQLPQSFDVNPGGGGVEIARTNFVIRLAPYYLPVLTLPLLLLKPFVLPAIRPVIDFMIGVTLGVHYAFLFQDFHGGQTDITKTGTIFSIIFTFLLNVVFLVIILCVVIDDYGAILDYFKDSFNRGIETYKAILQAWQTRQQPATGQLPGA
jgi:hypothetical protein